MLQMKKLLTAPQIWVWSSMPLPLPTPEGDHELKYFALVGSTAGQTILEAQSLYLRDSRRHVSGLSNLQTRRLRVRVRVRVRVSVRVRISTSDGIEGLRLEEWGGSFDKGVERRPCTTLTFTAFPHANRCSSTSIDRHSRVDVVAIASFRFNQDIDVVHA